ncbi:MAG: ATP phosphoribosyltransferase [Candidatus Helarchaeota archaeon]|nr:ATP phosphoribosyltransferase [Candidatus Helarchaeota archaeon]
MNKLRFVIPKGSLEEDTMDLLKQAGYSLVGTDRSYRPFINDPEIELKILRPQEIPNLIAQDAHDLGISGIDWTEESGVIDEVEDILDLEYGKVELVLAVPRDWNDIKNFSDLLKKFLNKNKPVRIFTELIATTKKYIMNNPVYKQKFQDKVPEIITPWSRNGENSQVKIILSFGATEAKPPEDAEAIVDLTATGKTIEENKLKVIDRLVSSTARLLANRKALKDPWKKGKIQDIKMLLKGVVEARKKLHIFMNIKNKNLPKLLKELPALKRPTIAPLSGIEGWSAINTIIPKDTFMKLMPILRKYAQGIVIHEPRQIIPSEEEE